jgi:hypothetical protein
MIWGKSIEWDHIMKGKTKYSGGVKIRDKKIEGLVGNGRVRVSSPGVPLQPPALRTCRVYPSPSLAVSTCKVYGLINAGMSDVWHPISPVSEWTKILMPEPVRYRKMRIQSGTGMLRYRTEI